MIDFFKNLNFPRGVILLSLIGSCALGWYVYEGSQRVEELAAEKAEAARIVTQIHQLGFAVEELAALRGNSNVIGVDDDIELRVRQIAKERNIAIGDVDISKNTRSVKAARDLEDVIYTLRPRDTEAEFSRARIGNFLYRLDESNRLVVTKIELNPADRLRPGEIGNDLWDYTIEVSSRQRQGGS